MRFEYNNQYEPAYFFVGVWGFWGCGVLDKEGKTRRRKLESQQEPQPQRNGSSLRMPLDPILTGEATAGSGEMDFDKTIEDMVSQVKSNPALSKTKCVVDRQLWMSNSRSLSPWSYRWVKHLLHYLALIQL